MPTWPLRVLLAAALATGPVQAQEIPPPAYQLAAQRAGIPSTVLYAVALQESGVRRDDRIVPWPWSLNVAGQSRRYATRAQACAGVRQALREVPPRASTWAWARSTSATSSTATASPAICSTPTTTCASPPTS